MTPVVRRLAVVGLGLLGGSVALAARARGAAAEVVGVARREETAREARERGVVDAAGLEPGEGVSGAELVVLATPVGAMPEALRKVAPHLAEGAVVTDVGSVKAALAEALPALLPAGRHYVGAHPMAGGHATGLAHARPELFEGAPCAVTPPPGADEAAVRRVERFFAALGARPLRRAPAVHDREVGWVSHLPHAVAFAFARALEGAPESAGALRGPGFRDFTRIAASDPALWGELLAANRGALAEPLRAVAARLGELAEAVAAGDAPALERFIASARESLARGAEDARSGGGSPEIPAASEAAPKERIEHS